MSNYNKEDKNIAIVTFPTGEIKGGHLLVERHLRVVEPLVQKIYAITGGYPQSSIFSAKINIINVTHKQGNNTLTKSINYAKTQFILAFELLKIIRKVDVVIFFIGGALLPSMCVAKIFRRKTIIITTGSAKESAKRIYKDVKIFSYILAILEFINYSLVDRIIVYSPSLVDYLGIKHYINKIAIAHEHFLDFDKFKMLHSITERGNLIGYIGRFSEEKGILNFVKAIPYILRERKDVNFLIGGDGQLRGEIEKYSNQHSLGKKINFTGWISHDKLPQYLNELKLIVLPSYTEGLPNIMLESMACGTPVLTTSVGAIPDFIKDGETGFIMDNNSPECIANNILRALSHPNWEQISDNGRALVEKEFTYKKAVEIYREYI